MERTKLFIMVLLFIIPLALASCRSTTESNIEIELAPIHEVTISIGESYSPQVFVNIKGGLSDGCTTFREIKPTRSGDTVSIEVTVQRPKGKICTAIYGYFEKTVALGSDFISGKTYTVKVNGEVKTFVMQ